MSRRRRVEDSAWRDPLIGLAEEVIDYYATKFQTGGYFMVSTFESFIRGQLMSGGYCDG
jgi:hypothetical protein